MQPLKLVSVKTIDINGDVDTSLSPRTRADSRFNRKRRRKTILRNIVTINFIIYDYLLIMFA